MISALQDPVKVELVGSWWDSVVPVAALLISLASIALTMWFRYSDRLQLRVALGESMYLDRVYGFLEDQDRITVSVTNRSRTASTELTSLVIQLDNGQTMAYTDPWPGDDQLPKQLGPGESARRSYPKQGVGIAFNNPGMAVAWIRAKADCGHREILGKKDRVRPGRLKEYARAHPHRHS